MKRLAAAGFLTCVLLLTGCAKITGQWTLDTMKPESEQKNFDVKCLVLNEDNTFCLMANEGPKVVETTGKYSYDQNTKALTFTPASGPARTYTAAVEMSGKMKVGPAEKGTWTAYLKPCKCDKCQHCGKMCPCPNPCGKNPRCPMAGEAKGDGKKPAEAKPDGKKTEQCPMHKTAPEPSKNKN
jgi:hypothetical protein